MAAGLVVLAVTTSVAVYTTQRGDPARVWGAIPPTSSTAVPPHSVAVIGDSLTSDAAMQLVSVGATFDWRVTADGIAGLTFEQRIASVQAVAKLSPNTVVIELGTNDAYQNLPSATTAATIAAAVTALERTHCVLFVNVGMLAINMGAATAINQALTAAVVGHPNMAVYDWSTEFHAHPGWSVDTIHVAPQYLSTFAGLVLGAARSHCTALDHA